MRGGFVKSVSLIMALFFPFAMLAADTNAMAFPNGAVRVNGNALSAPTAVFAGDKISTDKGSLSMTVAGSTVQVANESAVTYSPNEMSLSGGGIKVSTTTGFSGQVRNLTVRPQGNGKTVYTVAERDGKVMIASLEGNLTLSDGRGQVMLASNHAVAIPVQDTDQATCKKGDKKCEKAVKDCKGDKACEQQAVSAAAAGGAAAAGAGAAGGAAAGGAAAGAGAAAGLSTAAIVGISVAAAAAAAGIGVGIAKANESSSPSKP
jgi:hypothetical protein